MDAKTWVSGSVRLWYAAFLAARAVNVSRRHDIIDFVHIQGDAYARLHTVNMTYCCRVTDATFVHLRGIHTLI